MKNQILKSKITLLLVAVFTIAACSKDGEVGPAGAQGVQGEQGLVGPQGEQGEPGQDGADGQDGVDGQDGADGNANVLTIKYDISLESGNIIILEAPQITQGVLDDNVILTYLRGSSGIYYQAPGSGAQGAHFIEAYYNLGGVAIFFQGWDGQLLSINAGDYNDAKIIIIKSSSVVTGTTGKSGKEATLKELKQAGIDINNYQQVADYFGLED